MDLLKIPFNTSTVFGIVAITCASILGAILLKSLIKFMFDYSERALMKKTFKDPRHISALRPGYFVVHEVTDNKFLVSIAVVGQKQIMCDPEVNEYVPFRRGRVIPNGWRRVSVAYTIGDRFWVGSSFPISNYANTPVKEGTLLIKEHGSMSVVDQQRDVIWDKNIPEHVKWR